MEHKHTPGPWEVRFDHPDVPEKIAFIRPASHPHEYSGNEISSVYGCGPEAPGNETAKANASLIAAAPDLLAALRKAVDQALWPNESVSNALAEARAAIAKATGTQP